jgi:hypothetical protein
MPRLFAVMTKTFLLELKTGMFVPYQGMALVPLSTATTARHNGREFADLPGPQDGSWRTAPLR